jgi:hypothetical protein
MSCLRRHLLVPEKLARQAPGHRIDNTDAR